MTIYYEEFSRCLSCNLCIWYFASSKCVETSNSHFRQTEKTLNIILYSIYCYEADVLEMCYITVGKMLSEMKIP